MTNTLRAAKVDGKEDGDTARETIVAAWGPNIRADALF